MYQHFNPVRKAAGRSAAGAKACSDAPRIHLCFTMQSMSVSVSDILNDGYGKFGYIYREVHFLLLFVSRPKISS